MLHAVAVAILICLLALPASSQEADDPARGSPFSQAKFVPDISLVLDCSYLQRNLPDEEFSSLFRPGFPGEHGHSHRTEGFNLNYVEISFASIVDPYFELFAICHLSPEHVELEEAYGLTRKLPGGFQIKAGRFLSGFGRINELHTHYWDFADRPLVHEAFFGDEGLNEIGARLTWVAPSATYLLFGGEALMGDNEASFGRTGFDLPGGIVNAVRGPGLFVGFIESSVDLGDASMLARVSGAHGKTRHDDDFTAGEPGGHALTGTSTILGAALTVKHSFDAVRYFSFQSEYLWRNMEGTLYSLVAADELHQAGTTRRQAGLYAQAVAKLGLRVRCGIRYDAIWNNQVEEEFPAGIPRYSAMVEYNPTEFSRVRLQYNYDLSLYNDTSALLNRTAVHEVTLQVNLAIGAHGAHSF